MNNLCIIPARGGSKRIPRKNIKDFYGKPVVAFSIENALKSNLFNEVMVSTDDYEIRDIAIKYNAKVPFMRTENCANDYATTFDVIEEVVNNYAKNGIQFDNICCLYACTPLLSVDLIQKGYSVFIDNNFDTLFPIIEYSNPIQRAFKINNDRIEMFNPEYEMQRSQDLIKAYYDAGQFYWMNSNKLFLNKKIYCQNSGFISISEMQAQDIDNEIDWKLAELKYKLLNN